MDKDVLSKPYGTQLATPDLSPQELNFSIDVINTSQDDARHSNVIADLVSKVSLLEQTVLDLQMQVKQPHRETKESTTSLQSRPVSKPRVSSPSQMQIKQPKIQERIKYFELLHQTEKAINNRHNLRKDNASLQSLKQVSTRQSTRGLNLNNYDGNSAIRATIQPTDSSSVYEGRFQRLDTAVESLQQKLDTIDLMVKRLKSAGEPEPVIRVKVKKSQLEEFGYYYAIPCHPSESLDSKTLRERYCADQIGGTENRIIANTLTNNVSSTSLPFPFKPFDSKRGPLRQPCYKSEAHKHEDTKSSEPPAIEPPNSSSSSSEPMTKFDKFIQDDQIKYLLKQPALQFHLLSILTILQDGFINNLNQEQKLEVMNLKLNDLRKGGVEQNELVEEFVQRVLQLNEND
ncbi:HIT1 [Candida metapsilosis]|uniref:HIT1 n=1 Tax=Candida metapsilosis TaxID=273372 RepID=A0A8H8DB89_9ASCO|nr:HIT1 [Candida metapsilosis]